MSVLRALAYTAGFGGLGYTLMKVVTPDESKLAKVLPEGQNHYRSDNLKRRQAIVDVLQSAAEGRDPMYRQTREEIDTQKEKYLAKKST